MNFSAKPCARLLTFPNVVITRHRALFTRDALDGIAHPTVANVTELQPQGQCGSRVEA